MVLDRSLNTVLQTSGSFSSFRSLDNARNSVSTENGIVKEEGVEEFAAMIWNFVNSAGGLVHDLDTEVCGGRFTKTGWALTRWTNRTT